MHSLDLAMIGNCSFAALLDQRARVVWACIPRFDSDPVFCSLLQESPATGFYEVDVCDFLHSEQSYRHNSAVVETRLYDKHGNSLEIVDFVPRDKQFGRIFRPINIIRQITPPSGSPRITIRLRPSFDFGSKEPERTRKSNHVRYVIPDITLRLTTNAPVTYILEEVSFVLEKAWNPKIGSFAESFGGEDIDASLLLLPELGILPANDPRLISTFEQIEKRLRRGDHVIRYHAADDFGEPETTFNICAFWYIDALTTMGRSDEACELFTYMLSLRSPLGFLPEDLDPASGELWGNFPQTYSMAGLINSEMRLSKSWEEAF